MSGVSHRHICRYIDSFVSTGNKLCLIMEYCDRGDLAQYLERMKAMSKSSYMHTPSRRVSGLDDVGSTTNTTQLLNQVNLTELGEPRVWRFFLQICLALEVIHEKGIVHADLKPPNLLL